MNRWMNRQVKVLFEEVHPEKMVIMKDIPNSIFELQYREMPGWKVSC